MRGPRQAEHPANHGWILACLGRTCMLLALGLLMLALWLLSVQQVLLEPTEGHRLMCPPKVVLVDEAAARQKRRQTLMFGFRWSCQSSLVICFFSMILTQKSLSAFESGKSAPYL
jgi:hypothetical protein